MMQTCSITFDDLVDAYERRSDPETEARLRRHLEEGCAHCQERMTWIRDFLPALQSAITVVPLSAPADTVARARQIARERTFDPPLRERVAQLLFDSLRPLTPLAARGSAGQEVQQLYATEVHYIEIGIERMQEGGYYLIGQAVSKSDRVPIRPRSVLLIAEDGKRTQARQEGIEFHLSSVQAGAYQIRLRLDTEEILLPELRVGR